MISTILLVLAFVCFLLSAVRPTQPDWNRLMAAGLAALVAGLVLVRLGAPLVVR
jgi:hypothetical protein